MYLDDHEFFCVDDFFSQDMVAKVLAECQQQPCDDFIDKEGVWKGRLITQQRKMTHEWQELPYLTDMLGMVTDAFKRKDLQWHYVNFQLLYLPWDIHSDWEQTDSRVTYYNLVMPLEDANSHTILFDQRLDGSRHFHDYKARNDHAPEPVPQEIWDQHLAMCWPQDRQYLSIRQILPKQTAGQLQGFQSDIIHSSDNFHDKMHGPKKFVQAMLSIPR